MAKDTPGGPTTESLREALRSIADPASGKDIVAAGLVEGSSCAAAWCRCRC